MANPEWDNYKTDNDTLRGVINILKKHVAHLRLMIEHGAEGIEFHLQDEVNAANELIRKLEAMIRE